MRAVAVCNTKGGVGKTTTTMNVGVSLARRGRRVLLVDCDPQLSLTCWMGLDPDELDGEPTLYEVLRGQSLVSDAARATRWPNLWLVPGSPGLTEINRRGLVGDRVLLARLPEATDFTFFDCPASPGIVLTNALIAADQVLAPVQAKGMALDSIRRLRELVESVRRDGNPHLELLGILLCMYDERTRISKRVRESLESAYGSLVLEQVVHEAVVLAEAADAEQPIFERDPRCRAAGEYERVAALLERRTALGAGAAKEGTAERDTDGTTRSGRPQGAADRPTDGATGSRRPPQAEQADETTEDRGAEDRRVGTDTDAPSPRSPRLRAS